MTRKLRPWTYGEAAAGIGKRVRLIQHTWVTAMVLHIRPIAGNDFICEIAIPGAPVQAAELAERYETLNAHTGDWERCGVWEELIEEEV